MKHSASGLDRREMLLLLTGAAGATMLTGASKAAVEVKPVPDLSAWIAGTHQGRISLNREWRFLRSDAPGAQAPSFNDQTWSIVGLPHSFSLPYFRGVDFYVGYGWYRRNITIDPTKDRHRVAVEFEAAFQDTQIFVNGQLAGSHRGGYTSFQIDITDFVHPGENILAVRVNNLWNAELAPRAGDHIFDGGLYRNVWLVVKKPIHIAYQGFCVTTPHVSHQTAEVRIEADIENHHDTPLQCNLESKIISPIGRHVATIHTAATVPPGGRPTRLIGSAKITDPLLWHPDHPHLYRIETRVFDGKQLVDQQTSRFGLRWFEWTAEKGFFLNGRHCWIHGANVHQDHAGWASGATDAGAWRDVRLIKEAGFNFIRTSHYPHSRAFMDACDYYGILIWSEMCFWGVGGFGPDGDWRASAYPVKRQHWQGFEKSSLDQLSEMIAMHRNHPCIIAWSMCNEVFFTASSVFNRMKNLLLQMVRRSHELDPTRPAGIGGAQRGDVDKLGDIAGYNGDGATLFINPGIPNLVTEYGSVASVRPGPYSPNDGLLQPTHFAWRSGAAIWCGFDYGTWVGFTGKMGMVDYYRIPKNPWFWYRMYNDHVPPSSAAVSSKPVRLHLSADRLVIRGTDAFEDAHVLVRVLDEGGRLCDAAPNVTLRIVSGPGELPTGPSITFNNQSDIAIIAGLAAIEFRSYHAGQTVLKAESPGLEPAYLRITTTGEPRFIPGKTPRVRPRPYHRVPHPNQLSYLKHMSRHIDIALYRPTISCGFAPGHPGDFANDGEKHTFWLAPAHIDQPWWQVDLEGKYNIKDLSITTPRPGPYRCKVEFSVGGRHWTGRRILKIAAGTHEATLTFTPHQMTRYVRIVLIHAPVDGRGLSEVNIHGEVVG